MNAKLVVTLPAADIDRARAWYADKLGLKPVETLENGDTWYESGGSRFLVYQSQFAGTNQATAAGFEVDDFEAAMTELKGRGVRFEDYDFGDDFRTVDGVFTAPDGAKIAWFKDSEGNTLGVNES
jgi:catechol 2,3-dioxygenase-like lactoylglutathione lyase family enzyme